MRPNPPEPELDADQAMFRLYSLHYQSLIRLAVMLVQDVATAEEVVQDAFVAIHRTWPRLRDGQKAVAYLRQAVVNRSRSVPRRRGTATENPRGAPPDRPSTEHGALVLLESDAALAALRRLPGRQREAIILRYYADLSVAETSAAMGISRVAVKAHTARGMAALRDAIGQATSPPAPPGNSGHG